MHELIGKVLSKDMRWHGLRPLQERCFESIENGNNLLITAGTASGKTEAALLPVLSIICEHPVLRDSETPVGIYVAPLKALINDITARLQKLVYRSSLQVYSWHSDIPLSTKQSALKKASFLVTTPESMEGMIISKKSDANRLFSNLRFVLIDELHCLINSPRGAQLASLIERLQTISKHSIQRIAMSATIGNPQDVLQWLKGASPRNTEHIHDSNQTEKRLLIVDQTLLQLENDLSKMMTTSGKGIVFTSSKQEAENIYTHIRKLGYPCLLHHGSMGKEIRNRSEAAFKTNDRYRIMVATTTLEMGIDIGDVAYVFFYSVPSSTSSFMQRIGRAGRKTGISRSILYVNTQEENPKKRMETHLKLFGNLQLFMEGRVEPIPLSQNYYQILAHQILSMVLSEYRIPHSRLAVLKQAFPFQKISIDEFRQMLDYLFQKGFLSENNGTLRMGYKSNEMLSPLNLGEFVSVFDVGEEFTVYSGEKEIGKIHKATLKVLSQMEQAGIGRSFFLSGKAWRVDSLDMKTRKVWVSPEKNGIPPLWLGSSESIARRFAKAVRAFMIRPSFSDLIQIDPIVQDSLLQTIDTLRYTVSDQEPWVLAPVMGKTFVDYSMYTYEGDLKNLALSLWIQSSLADTRTIKWDWKRVQFRASTVLEAEELYREVHGMEYEDYREAVEEIVTDRMPEIARRLFHDSCSEFIPGNLLLESCIQTLWSGIQETDE